MTVKVEVFTSPTCPHCPHAITLARQMEKEIDYIKVIETSTGTAYGQKRAQQFGIMSVPTLIITGPAIDQPIGLRGVPSRNGFLKAVEIAEGLRAFEEEKSLGEIIKEKLRSLFAKSQASESSSE